MAQSQIDLTAKNSSPSVEKRLVGIMGASLATGNRGVSALGASLIALIKEIAPRAEPVMLIGSRNDEPFTLRLGSTLETVRVLGFRLSPYSDWSKNIFVIFFLALFYKLLPLNWTRLGVLRACPWLKVVASAGFIGDVRGGDSFSDIYGVRNFLIASLPAIAVILVRNHITLLPQTYGPFRSRISEVVARYILRRADVILTRDYESQGTIRRLIGENQKTRFCNDVAFSLEPTRLTFVESEPPLPTNHDNCLIGLNVNGLMFNGGYTRSNMFGLKLDYNDFLVRLVEMVLREPNNRLLLVPHTYAPQGNVESDTDASRRLLARISERLRDRIHLVSKEYDQNEIKGVIGLCGFFIGSRMHSCIAAMSQGIPTIGVAYSKKFKGVFESVGATDWVIDGRTTGTDQALAAFNELFQKRVETGKNLLEEAQKARTLLRQTFSSFCFRPVE